MLKDLFHKKKYATIDVNSRPKGKILSSNSRAIDDEDYIKCHKCNEVLSKEKVDNNLKVCYKCGYHFRINVRDRIKFIVDTNTFVEYDENLVSSDPLSFPKYDEKIRKAMESSGSNEAVITGEGKINGISVILCFMEARFIMGSMGSVVGEKITRSIERAIEKRLPVIIFSASGGARMQEGILSLMQMAKTSAVLNKLSKEGLLYISFLTDPTTGGVTASFAMLGDIILAEPEALVGFAGPRVIKQTIRQELPKEFQKSEYLLKKGFIDKIVPRNEIKDTLYKILYIHSLGGEICG